jgi:hypothetical protein
VSAFSFCSPSAKALSFPFTNHRQCLFTFRLREAAMKLGESIMFQVLKSVCAAVVALSAVACQAQLFDVADDFSKTNNPNGAWSYGWSLTLGSSFILSTDASVREGLDTWRGNFANDGNPSVLHNGTGSTILLAGSVPFEPGEFGFHPGPSGENALVRWTASEPGLVSITSVFTGQDNGTTTDVHVLHNGLSIFDGLVEDFGNGINFDTSLMLSQADTIDFAVGYGSNNNFSFDSTSLAATVLFVIPEPTTCTLALAALCLAMSRRRGR